MTGCGWEWWVAEELWRMATTTPRDKPEFIRTVVRMLLCGQRQNRKSKGTIYLTPSMHWGIILSRK